MRCIYCLEESKANAGRAHIIPEALAQNDIVLPIGAVCDPCNNYLGKLDATLASHPMISLGIQVLKLPGKDGRIRKRVGNVSRDEVPGAVTMPVGPPDMKRMRETGEDSATPLVDRSFEELRFRRALHHVGFNLMAARDGVEKAYDSMFDPVRKYVRNAKRDEAWPFAQQMQINNMSPAIKVLFVRRQPALIVGMRLFAALFYVDLLNSGSLAGFIERERQGFPDLHFIGSDKRLPREPKRKDRKHSTEYRISIYVDEDEDSAGPPADPVSHN